KAAPGEARPREQFGGARGRTRAAQLAARGALAARACTRRMGDDPVGTRTTRPRGDPHAGGAGCYRLAFRVGERGARRAVWSAFTAAPAHRIRRIVARCHYRARIRRSTVARSRLYAEALRRSH